MPASRASALNSVLLLASLAIFTAAPGTAAEPDSTAVRADTTGAEGADPNIDLDSAMAEDPVFRSRELERRLIDAGFENVTVEAGETTRVAYENRRWRHSADALGRAAAITGRNARFYEKRLGLTVAAFTIEGGDSVPRFRAHYPSDPRFVPPPEGRAQSRTFRRADLEAGPLVDYRVGQLFNPLELRVELQPRVRLNPWPGAMVQLGVLIPIENDYPAGPLDPDAGRFRPGRMSLDQFFWLPQVALGSVSAGYFGDHRWGASAGLACPLREGEWILDAQYDRTGFLAFTEAATLYSELEVNTASAGISYRPGFRDVTLRARAAQFLYGDRGGELEVSRRFGDFELAYFALRSEGLTTVGLRLDLPVPPRVRSGGTPVRVQPVSRFGISFRDESAPLGTWISGVASREDFLRQANRPGLETSRERFLAAEAGKAGSVRPPAATGWVSMSGMTGFIHTPWAGVMPDRGFEAGYNWVPKAWTYDHRGTHDNQIFYGTLGFLPRVETAMRWTRIPGYHSFEEIVPDSRLVDIDRMTSGRLELLTPRANRPGLAVGVEDVQGTRRFHSAYVVAGMPGAIFGVVGRASFGYGSRAFETSQYVLDGAFGALELVPTRFIRVQAEYDSEKWNAGLGMTPGFGFQLRAALLNLESFSLGLGWAHSL